MNDSFEITEIYSRTIFTKISWKQSSFTKYFSAEKAILRLMFFVYLLYRKADFPDAGIYMCNATNIFGHESSNGSLVVKERTRIIAGRVALFSNFINVTQILRETNFGKFWVPKIIILLISEALIFFLEFCSIFWHWHFPRLKFQSIKKE